MGGWVQKSESVEPTNATENWNMTEVSIAHKRKDDKALAALPAAYLNLQQKN